MKKVTSRGLLFGVVALMLGVMTSVPADTASGFSIETVAGTWIGHLQGTVALALPGIGGKPFATINRFTINEDGTCTRGVGQTVTTLGSLPPSAPLISCTVLVNPDGAGSATLTDLSPFSPTVINFRIVHADKLEGLPTAGPMADPLVGVFHLERSTDPASSDFSLETIQGTWITQAQGTAALALPVIGGQPIATITRFMFNEDGTCEREAEAVVTTFGSLPTPPLISCTVIVNPDGTGSVTIVNLSPFSPSVINFRIVTQDKLVGLTTVGVMSDPVVEVIHFKRVCFFARQENDSRSRLVGPGGCARPERSRR